MRRRSLRGVVCLALSLTFVTCEQPTGLRDTGRAALNIAAFAAGASGVPVPVDSLEIILTRAVEQTRAVDTVIAIKHSAVTGDSLVVRLNVALRQSPEDFVLAARAFGRGIDWYTASSPVRISAGATSFPANLAVRYVGPGTGGRSLFVAPQDTTIVAGVPFALRATVLDAAENPITGVPIGYRVRDTLAGTVSYSTPYLALFTGRPVRDSVWLVAETPTHLKDSTRVHIVPPAVSLVKKSGDLQTSVINVPLPAPLTVRVVDALGGGFKGDTVWWVLQSGAGALAAAFSVSDDSGFAAMTATPLGVGGLSVQAAASGLQGSPVTFGATAIAGTISTVAIAPKVDTVVNGGTLQYTAIARSAAGTVVNTTFGWVSTTASVAAIDATNGLAVAVGGDSTLIIATAGGVADTAVLYVRALQRITVDPADTVVTAIGDALVLRAAAHDNFGKPMTAANLRFASTSPGVATVNRMSGLVQIVGAGTAVIMATDSVTTSDSTIHGFATVHVDQSTAAIVNTPGDTGSLQVAVGGQSQIVARAIDRNGYPIAGKKFVWASADSSIARVTKGLVTGVALGTTIVVDSVDGLGAYTRVSVVSAPPRQIHWAFDSLSVANGGSIAVAITVTEPPSTPLTISISSSDDAIVQASPVSVTIPQNASGTSTLVYGLREGRALLTASDASGRGYEGRSMTVDVVAQLDSTLLLNTPPDGLGPEQSAPMTVSIPFVTDKPVLVDLNVSSSGGVLSVPSQVTIPAGSSYGYFDVTATGKVGDKGTLRATAAGFYDAPPVTILLGQPVLAVVLATPILSGVPVALSVYARDAAGTTRNVSKAVVVTLTSSDQSSTTFGSTTLTIPPGGSSASTSVIFSKVGSFLIGASAAGYSDATTQTAAQ